MGLASQQRRSRQVATQISPNLWWNKMSYIRGIPKLISPLTRPLLFATTRPNVAVRTISLTKINNTNKDNSVEVVYNDKNAKEGKKKNNVMTGMFQETSSKSKMEVTETDGVWHIRFTDEFYDQHVDFKIGEEFDYVNKRGWNVKAVVNLENNKMTLFHMDKETGKTLARTITEFRGDEVFQTSITGEEKLPSSVKTFKR